MQATIESELTGMPPNPLSAEELRKINAYWRAANYLSVGQIYLYDNPLLTEPLRIEHIKPRLLGHWGTTPGLNFVYVHANRIIQKYDLNMIYICGPGHGGPGMVANTWLEGTYSELFPNITQDVEGMKRLFTQFSFPGGIPSHAAPETPGSINEGGELGYSLAARLRRSVRQPGPYRVLRDRRRRSGNRRARHELAFQQVFEPGARRSGDSDPASQRIQDRRSDGSREDSPGRTGRAAPRLRLPSLFCRRTRARADASTDGRDSRHRGGRDSRDPERGARKWLLASAAVAHDRAGESQGLDRSKSRGWIAD